MSEYLNTLLAHLGRGEPLVQATILAALGSTPRAAGSRMLLAPEAGGGGPSVRIDMQADMRSGVQIVMGTVGGGLVEAQVMARAAQILGHAEGHVDRRAEQRVERCAGRCDKRCVEQFDLTGELAAGADMICGGRLCVFLERLGPGDLPLFRRLAQALNQGQRCLRLTPLAHGPASLLLPEGECFRGEYFEGEYFEGEGFGAGADGELALEARRAGQGIATPVVLNAGGQGYALEPWAAASPLYIFGAGHVSRPTAQVAAMLGFRVTVLDDRPDFASAERFPQATTTVLASYDDCFAGLLTGPEAFVVIVTRGHLHDAEVLAQALRTSAGYIGMIGSRRKRDAVYARLRGQGFSEADLGRVRCPIGLAIGAETPEEIAVSISAELVAFRAGLRAGGPLP